MEIQEILNELNKLPKETLVFKTIKGKAQPYLQWSEGGKTKSRYIKKVERESVLKQFEKKEELKKLYNKKVDEILDDYKDTYYYVSDIEKPFHIKEYSKSEKLITKKDETSIFSVERDYINSKAFHDIFTKIPLSHEVQECLYQETGRLLNYVDGKDEEHMIAISSRTGRLIVDNLNRTGISRHTYFSEAEYNKIKKTQDSIILIHNHSLNGRPSAKDLISYALDDKVRLSIIACHNGTIYAIFKAKKIIENIYHDLYDKEKERWNDAELAKIHATNNLYLLNDKLGLKQKIFDLRRF